jgi:drug/metabolite transporter (DMT)-like permease
MCAFYAFKNLPASDVVVITNMFPIWVAILSWPILGERPGPGVWPAVLCSVAGAALINYQSGDAVTAGGDRIGGAIAAGVSSVLSAVVVIGLNLLHRVPSQAIVVHFSGVATVFCLALMPLAGAENSHLSTLNSGTMLRLAGMGLFASIGQIFLTKAFAAGPASKVAVVALSQVVFCYVFELGFLGRAFQWQSLAGMMLIVVPTAWMLLHGEVSRAASVPPGPADGME